MPINADKPHLWKADVERSIEFYNDWFLRFAPATFRAQRVKTVAQVKEAFELTSYLRSLSPEVLEQYPKILPVMRMMTAPPLARDRLMGLAYASKTLIEAMEGKEEQAPRLPPRMQRKQVREELQRICDILDELADRDLMPWLDVGKTPGAPAADRAAMVIADRLCGSASDPIIRNAQERRQLNALRRWLTRQGCRFVPVVQIDGFADLKPGTFTFRLNIPVGKPGQPINVPVDCAIQPSRAMPGALPLLIEAKSAGDATNTNKRRKEEAQKFSQLRERYGEGTKFLLLLCGYFEPGYLGYEAAEGIDWVWEHRLDDLSLALEIGSQKKSSELNEDGTAYDSPDGGTLESRRLDAQRKVDESRSGEERNRLGQFSTPFSLASAIVRRAVSLLEGKPAIDFLEPAAGTGVFFSGLRAAMAKTVRTCIGVEIDPAYGAAARSLWEPDGVVLHLEDFFAFAGKPEHQGCFNLLCTNPPYVRHHHLAPEQKQILRARVQSRLELTPSGLSGLYVYFVLLADPLLRENGVASWLIPSEFLSVNYGRVLREYLSTRVTLLDVFQFDPDAVQFDDALVSSCVVTYRKARPGADADFTFRYGGDFSERGLERRLRIAELARSPKWAWAQQDEVTSLTPSGIVLGDLFEVKRGIATGANHFFVFDPATAEARKIPAQFLRPVLTSPRDLKSEVIETDERGWPRLPKVRLLLDCRMRPEELRERHPSLWNYLKEGETSGLPGRYLCASREFWYFQEQRSPPPFLVSYMGRSLANRSAPLRFFVNLSQAVPTNVFLGLYPKPALAVALEQNPGRLAELCDVLNRISKAELSRNGRCYGGGLHKIEPKELLGVRLCDSPDWLVSSATPQPDLPLVFGAD